MKCMSIERQHFKQMIKKNLKLGIYLFHKNYSIFWREIYIWSEKLWFKFFSRVVLTVVEKNQTGHGGSIDPWRQYWLTMEAILPREGNSHIWWTSRDAISTNYMHAFRYEVYQKSIAAVGYYCTITTTDYNIKAVSEKIPDPCDKVSSFNLHLLTLTTLRYMIKQNQLRFFLW